MDGMRVCFWFLRRAKVIADREINVSLIEAKFIQVQFNIISWHRLPVLLIMKVFLLTASHRRPPGFLSTCHRIRFRSAVRLLNRYKRRCQMEHNERTKKQRKSNTRISKTSCDGEMMWKHEMETQNTIYFHFNFPSSFSSQHSPLNKTENQLNYSSRQLFPSKKCFAFFAGWFSFLAESVRNVALCTHWTDKYITINVLWLRIGQC